LLNLIAIEWGSRFGFKNENCFENGIWEFEIGIAKWGFIVQKWSWKTRNTN